MCYSCESNIIHFISFLGIALISIFFVWLGRKYKFAYYNALLLGWLGYFGILFLSQWYNRHVIKY